MRIILKTLKKQPNILLKNKKEFLFDAEHFFDGYKNNPNYALDCLKQALMKVLDG